MGTRLIVFVWTALHQMMCKLGGFQPRVRGRGSLMWTCLTNRGLTCSQKGSAEGRLRLVGWFGDFLDCLPQRPSYFLSHVFTLSISVTPELFVDGYQCRWGHMLCLNRIAEGWQCVGGEWERLKAADVSCRHRPEVLPSVSLVQLRVWASNSHLGVACPDWQTSVPDLLLARKKMKGHCWA